jgi:sarcosine oxidase delta subunit
MTKIICPYCHCNIISKEYQNHGETELIICEKCKNKFEIMLHNRPFIIYRKLSNPQLEYVLEQ